MIITCPCEKKQFKIDSSLIPNEGRELQCGSCERVWFYKPQNESDYYGLRYAEFVVPMVKAIQEQQNQIELLQKQVQLLMELNRELLREQEVKPTAR